MNAELQKVVDKIHDAANIVDVIGDTVDIIDVMKPVYNFKAAEDEAPPWKKDKA